MPHLEEQRVRDLLAWVVSLQEGAAVIYLLQLLVQTTGPEAPNSEGQSGYMQLAVQR